MIRVFPVKKEEIDTGREGCSHDLVRAGSGGRDCAAVSVCTAWTLYAVLDRSFYKDVLPDGTRSWTRFQPPEGGQRFPTDSQEDA